jgi:hypothetical protein
VCSCLCPALYLRNVRCRVCFCLCPALYTTSGAACVRVCAPLSTYATSGAACVFVCALLCNNVWCCVCSCLCPALYLRNVRCCVCFCLCPALYTAVLRTLICAQCHFVAWSALAFGRRVNPCLHSFTHSHGQTRSHRQLRFCKSLVITNMWLTLLLPPQTPPQSPPPPPPQPPRPPPSPHTHTHTHTHIFRTAPKPIAAKSRESQVKSSPAKPPHANNGKSGREKIPSKATRKTTASESEDDAASELTAAADDGASTPTTPPGPWRVTSPYATAAAAAGSAGGQAPDDGLFPWQRQRFELSDDEYWETLGERRAELIERDLATSPQKVMPLMHTLCNCTSSCVESERTCLSQ